MEDLEPPPLLNAYQCASWLPDVLPYVTPFWAKLYNLIQCNKKRFIITVCTVTDYMSSKQVRTEVPVDGKTISEYSFVNRTMDSAAVQNSLFCH